MPRRRPVLSSAIVAGKPKNKAGQPAAAPVDIQPPAFSSTWDKRPDPPGLETWRPGLAICTCAVRRN